MLAMTWRSIAVRLAKSRPVVLDDPVHPAFDVVAAQHLQDHVLGRAPFRQFAFQPHAPHLGHADVQRSPGDGERHLESADPDREHAQRTRGRRVRIRADHGLAGNAEALHVGRMRDPVARLGEPQSEALRGGAQIFVIFGVLLVGLQQVVVDVLHADLGARVIESERLELLHHQRAGRVLGQRLVDTDRDLFARCHLAGFQVRFDQLVSDIERHRGVLPNRVAGDPWPCVPR